MSRLVNFIAFEIGWFGCILGAAHGLAWVGPVLVATLVTAHVWLSPTGQRELCLIVLAAAIGFVVDTVHAVLGVVRFTGQDSVWCPMWMVALWANLATTLNWSLGGLRGRYVVAAVLGALAGPTSYYAGQRLEAITLHPQQAFAAGVLALAWGVATPALLGLSSRFVPPTLHEATHSETHRESTPAQQGFGQE